MVAVRSRRMRPEGSPGSAGFQSGEGRMGSSAMLSGQQSHVQQRLLPGFQIARGEVRVQISGQQRRLEKQQAGAPHRRRSAEPGQDDFADHRLHFEQQKCAEKNGRGVEQGVIIAQ